MTIVTTGKEWRHALTRHDQPHILVPTMGALHQGHLSLIRLARQVVGPTGLVSVSIFVNPIQFDRAGDLAHYPRPLEQDLAWCRAEGVDVVFVPEVAAMYATDRSVTVTETSLSSTLCGAKRPGHFDGVCTVVLKLFMLSGCHAAVFGEKDYQQLAIIRRMVRDLDLPVEIIAGATLREPDGLAMSSRNVRLTPEHRADAPRIRRALLAAAAQTTATQVVQTARELLLGSAHASIDYLELVDATTLQPVAALTQPTVLATAVFYGEVRLIDHIAIPPRLA